MNADDLGHSAAVNAGIRDARHRGIVKSASLMVLRPAAEEAAEFARAEPDLSVGLHVDLGEWTYREVEWTALYETEVGEVAGSIRGQLDAFRALTGRNPTHIDSHQHAHLREPARSLVAALGRELEVPVRHLDSRTRYSGSFYGQTAEGDPLPDAITVKALLDLFTSLPEGTTEICCHPGKGEIPGSSYGPERQRELDALCDPRVPEGLVSSGIELISFHEVR